MVNLGRTTATCSSVVSSCSCSARWSTTVWSRSLARSTWLLLNKRNKMLTLASPKTSDLYWLTKSLNKRSRFEGEELKICWLFLTTLSPITDYKMRKTEDMDHPLLILCENSVVSFENSSVDPIYIFFFFWLAQQLEASYPIVHLTRC